MAIYSNSVITNGPLLIISGQTPQKEDVIPVTIEEQLEVVIAKIDALIAENGGRATDIVKMNVYITETAYLGGVRDVLGAYLKEKKPAMTLVVVAGLIHPDYKVEIDAIVSV